MKLHSNSLGMSRPAVRRGGLLLGALASMLLMATSAHAETDMRICGLISKRSAHPSEAVGFVMKVQKNDSRKCEEALNSALQRFNAVGGTRSIQGMNRIWRRVRNGGVGPFGAGQDIYSQSFSRRTCEDFSWYVTNGSTDYCFQMTRNKLYAMAGAYREFAIRGE